MLKVFKNSKNSREEIHPSHGIYEVLETGKYSIEYFGEIFDNNVFLEDYKIDLTKYSIYTDKIILQDAMHFQDYFGYTSLRLNKENFHFNIKIEKFKLSEIEEIFMFLWQKEEKIFNIFFSKSTQKLDFKKNGLKIGQTSKLLTFLEFFAKKFDDLFRSFNKSPHTILRKKKAIIDYSNAKFSPYSVDWILSNLDCLHFHENYKNHPDSIRVKNQFGIIDKIETENNFNSFANYENEIILGAFKQILNKLSLLKKEIKSNVNLVENKNNKYADFKDLKKIPYIKLFEDSYSLEKTIRKLQKRYQTLFIGTKPRSERPRLTPVFSKRLHYQKAFKLIKNLREYKFKLDGEFKLLNIKKLSQLYEVYNLYRGFPCFRGYKK